MEIHYKSKKKKLLDFIYDVCYTNRRKRICGSRMTADEYATTWEHHCFKNKAYQIQMKESG